MLETKAHFKLFIKRGKPYIQEDLDTSTKLYIICNIINAYASAPHKMTSNLFSAFSSAPLSPSFCFNVGYVSILCPSLTSLWSEDAATQGDAQVIKNVLLCSDRCRMEHLSEHGDKVYLVYLHPVVLLSAINLTYLLVLVLTSCLLLKDNGKNLICPTTLESPFTFCHVRNANMF